MYRDKEKQKESTKERVRRYRERQKGVTSDDYARKLMLIYGELKRASFYSPRLSTQCNGPDAVRIGIDGPTFKDVEDSIK